MPRYAAYDEHSQCLGFAEFPEGVTPSQEDLVTIKNFLKNIRRSRSFAELLAEREQIEERAAFARRRKNRGY